MTTGQRGHRLRRGKTHAPALITPPPLRGASTPTTPQRTPLTVTGTLLGCSVPSPSTPSWLNPQHCTIPVVIRAQLCVPPEETSRALSMPTMASGKAVDSIPS